MLEQPPPITNSEAFAEEYKTSQEFEETNYILNEPGELIPEGLVLKDHKGESTYVTGFWYDKRYS